MTEFKNRVFGCAIVKAINANYNADFSGQPRTLPNGTVYATDKAFKYTVKNYLKDVYPKEIVFYFKSLNENMNPISLDETYKKYFKKDADKDKKEVSKNLLSCIDIRLFGATFAGKTNISVHGPVQVNHAVNIWSENNIYNEQITSPFSNKSNDPDAEKGMTTIGRQARLEEGHYLHHFSINPQNLCDITSLAGADCAKLTDEDIAKLKEAMRRGATWYDSASKAGCENEMLVWVQLKTDSKAVLPNFTDLITLKEEKNEGKCVYDFAKLKEVLTKVSSEIDSIDVFYNKQTCKLENLPEKANPNDL
ncbi:MAG: type I CRISPR-associated protein Cas7 [Paludibacteraceae bacterium]|jgi:CRISPR-associated protein Csh2|nr:type I CRISPR-associated protein Cas7 [Paludibacteraceae bacterium]